MIDWKRKLSSRKFWAAVAGFVTAVLIALNVPELKVSQTVTVISSLGVLAAYIFAEGYADAKSKEDEEK